MATSKPSPAEGESAPAEAPPITVNGQTPNTEVPDLPTGTEPGEMPKMAELEGIRYTGMADSKTLTAADLESLGVENPKGDLVWDDHNGKVVLTGEFNAATRDVLLADPDFAAQ